MSEHLDPFEEQVAGAHLDAAIETVRAETSIETSLTTMVAGIACAMQATGSPPAIALARELINRTQDMVKAVKANIETKEIL